MKYLYTVLFLAFFQLSFAQVAEFLSKSNSDLIDDDIASISVDQNGNKWIGTSKFGLTMFDNEKFEAFNENNSVIEGSYISPIYSDSKANVWVSFSDPKDGIAKYDGSDWITYAEKDLPTSTISVISICEDKNGNIYFGGKEGILVYDGEDWDKVNLPEGSYIVRTMDISSNGDMAIGHNSGLLLRIKNKWKSLTTENSELRLGTVRSVKFLSGDDLIIGYGGGFGDGGFSIIVDDKWAHYNKSNSKISDHMVRDIEVDKNGTIWMATNNGVIKMENGEITPILFREGLYKNVILDLAIENKIVWIATNFGIVKVH